MTNELDMSECITRNEFQDAISSLATRRELEIWGGALLGRMDAQFESFQLHMDFMRRNMEAIGRDMQRDMETMRSELQTQLARLEPSRSVAASATALLRAIVRCPAGSRTIVRYPDKASRQNDGIT